MRSGLEATTARRRAVALAAPALLLLALGACEGENLFRNSALGPDDRRNPTVVVEEPGPGQRVALGDSVLVRIRVADEHGLAKVELEGVAVRGNLQLGTQTLVPRFHPKVVDLEAIQPVVRDTILIRYLVATPDSVARDTVLIVARVTDLSNNVVADTVRITIGGPRVRIAAPESGAEIPAGGELRVRLVAADSIHRLESLRLVSTGAFEADTTLRFDATRTHVDTVVALGVPTASGSGDFELRATARNSINDSTTTPATVLRLLPPSTDNVAPTVHFRVVAPQRAERSDSVAVTVVATDNIRVDRVGVTLLPLHRLSSGTDTFPAYSRRLPADSATFRVALADLGLPVPLGTSTLRLEVTAFALDSAGNCATATIPETMLSEACVIRGDTVYAGRPGSRSDVLVVRGATVRPRTSSDQLADLIADTGGRQVFVSNFTRNRIELLPFGATAFSDSIRVGAEPWGVTIGVTGDTLYVANSAGTNVSVVPLATLREAESLRIAPADVRLFGVDYKVENDSIQNVTVHDYSDRPQFVAQISSGQLIYSTKPTLTRDPGTIRIIDPAKDQAREPGRGSEIFVGYATTAIGKGIVVNALSAAVTLSNEMTVCPRRRLSSAQQSDPPCLTGTATFVHNELAALQAAGLSDTRFELGRDIASIALTDTTFVAVSRDHSTIAFGEGAAAPGRVFLFRDVGGNLQGSSSETEDLVGNAAERVISLALNGDGTLGAARGQRAYFFDNSLRLAGQVATGSGTPTGGVALHPLGVDYPSSTSHRRAFVSAVDETGAPYIDLIDAFSFRSIHKIYVRDPIVGTLVAVPVLAGDPGFGELAVRVFGITSTGVLQLELTHADLQ